MAANLIHWERRDAADRGELGTAAYELCKASRGQDGVTGARFFWVTPDRIAVLTEATSQHVFDDPPKPEMAAAMFRLADLATAVDSERWMDPRDGQATYRTAGR